MSKYEPLSRYLEKQGAKVALSFATIESIIGSALPPSARRHAAWWSNNVGSHVQADSWIEAGFKTEDVDIAGQKVSFAPAKELQGFGETSQASFAEQGQAPVPPAQHGKLRHPAWGVWKGLVRTPPGVDLTEPAEPDWGKVYDPDHPVKLYEP